MRMLFSGRGWCWYWGIRGMKMRVGLDRWVPDDGSRSHGVKVAVVGMHTHYYYYYYY